MDLKQMQRNSGPSETQEEITQGVSRESIRRDEREWGSKVFRQMIAENF